MNKKIWLEVLAVDSSGIEVNLVEFVPAFNDQEQ